MPENTAQSCEFRAEVRKVLSILTNSLYTNRETGQAALPQQPGRDPAL